MRAFAFAAVVLVAAAAHAQGPDYTLLGAAVRSRPAYDGASKRETDLIPVVRYYGHPWFARTTEGILEGGARYALAPALAVGAQLAYEPGRDSPDVGAGASIGAHVEWEPKLGPIPLDFLLRARQHLSSDKGAQLDLRATAGVYARGPFEAGVFGQATWANAKSNRAFYGVSKGGLLYTSLGALWSWTLSPRWLLVGSLEHRRLQDGAADSAEIDRSTANYVSAGAAYRF